MCADDLVDRTNIRSVIKDALCKIKPVFIQLKYSRHSRNIHQNQIQICEWISVF